MLSMNGYSFYYIDECVKYILILKNKLRKGNKRKELCIHCYFK